MRVASVTAARAGIVALTLAVAACGGSTSAGHSPSTEPSASASPIVVATQSFGAKEPVGLAVGAGRVWSVSVKDGEVVGHAGATGGAALHVRVGDTPLRAVYDGRLLWISVFGADQVVAVDPANGTVVRRVHVAGQPEGLAAAFGAVWVVRQEAKLLTRITSDGTFGPSYRLGDEPRLVTADGHYLFASNFTDGTITRIDPASGTSRTSDHLCTGAQDMAVAGNTLWVSCTASDIVAAVDVDSLREVGHVKVAGEPDAIRVVGSNVYVVTTTGPTLVEIAGDASHPTIARRTTLGDAPALNDVANVDAVVFHGQWWVSSPVSDRVLVYTPDDGSP